MHIDVPTRFPRDWEHSDAEEPLRIAVVGLGWFGREVAVPCIEDSDYCALGAVVSGTAEKAERVAAEHDVPAALTYEAYAEGEAADAYDAVYVVTPNALHLPHVETAAELDKAILCEKPLEATVERGREIVSVCESADVPLMTAYRMQTTRSMRWVENLVDDGAIGDPVQIHGEFSLPVLDRGGPDQWRLDRELAGGGALMDIGVYPTNTARFVLDRDPTAVAATTYATEPAFDGVDEHVGFQLEFPGPVTAACTASFGAAATSRFAVLGTEGRVVVENPFEVNADREITVETAEGTAVVDVSEPHEIAEEFDFFARQVQSDGPVEPDGEHGVVDLEIAAAIYESAETGERVDLR